MHLDFGAMMFSDKSAVATFAAAIAEMCTVATFVEKFSPTDTGLLYKFLEQLLPDFSGGRPQTPACYTTLRCFVTVSSWALHC
jgi:hypothetical protein